jgi:hypothetical protein
MKLGQLVLVIILSVAAAIVTVHYADGTHGAMPARETAYERVMRTRTLGLGLN